MASSPPVSDYQVARVVQNTGMSAASARRHLEALNVPADAPAFGPIAHRYRTDLDFRNQVDAQQARYQQQYDAWHAGCDAARDAARAGAPA